MIKKHLSIFLVLAMLVVGITGCGFHLRGYFTIAKAFQELRILPNQPGDPFQRALRQALKMNRVCIVDASDPRYEGVATLTLFNPCFSERAVAYGRDAQVNRAVLEFKLCYQITDANGNELIPRTNIQVQREFTVIPNEVLLTNNERDRVRSDLLIDASTQLMRQLSVVATE